MKTFVLVTIKDFNKIYSYIYIYFYNLWIIKHIATCRCRFKIVIQKIQKLHKHYILIATKVQMEKCGPRLEIPDYIYF